MYTREEMGRKLLYDLGKGNLKEAFDAVRDGAWINMKDSSGAMALSLAASGGHAEMVQELLDRNAEVNQKDNEGYTPLMWAAYAGSGAAVAKLIAAGADVDARNIAGESAADLAKSQGHQLVANAIIDIVIEKRQAAAEEWKQVSVAASRDITVSKPLQFKLGPKSQFVFIR